MGHVGIPELWIGSRTEVCGSVKVLYLMQEQLYPIEPTRFDRMLL